MSLGVYSIISHLFKKIKCNSFVVSSHACDQLGYTIAPHMNTYKYTQTRASHINYVGLIIYTSTP